MRMRDVIYFLAVVGALLIVALGLAQITQPSGVPKEADVSPEAQEAVPSAFHLSEAELDAEVRAAVAVAAAFVQGARSGGYEAVAELLEPGHHIELTRRRVERLSLEPIPPPLLAVGRGSAGGEMLVRTIFGGNDGSRIVLVLRLQQAQWRVRRLRIEDA